MLRDTSISGDGFGQVSSTEITCNQKGQIVKLRYFEYKEDGSKDYDSTWWYTFKYNKKGYITLKKRVNSQKTLRTTKYSYDKKKNLKKIKDPYKSFNFKLKYNKKGLVKHQSGDGSYTFIYKKKKVKKNMLSKVKAQRWAIINFDTNLEFIEGI